MNLPENYDYSLNNVRYILLVYFLIQLQIPYFSYTFNVFKKGYQKELQEEDLYEVISLYKSSKLGDDFENDWNDEILKPKPALTKVIARRFGKSILGWGIGKMIIRVIYT